MFASAFAVILWASQMTMAQITTGPVESIIETSAQGTYVGTIARDTEASAGVWIAPDGTMTVEVR